MLTGAQFPLLPSTWAAVQGPPERDVIDAGQPVGLRVPEGALEEVLEPGPDPAVPAAVHHHGQVLGDDGGAEGLLQLEVGGDCHVDRLSGGRDAVQQRGVMQGGVPRGLEAEYGATAPERGINRLFKKVPFQSNFKTTNFAIIMYQQLCLCTIMSSFGKTCSIE